MYSIVFTSLLVIILCWKTHKLITKKRVSGDFKGIDDELVIMVNEGEAID
ncbi:hypothetical protein [Neobacillus jeddahensis]|nr:hypothetical protein [Neobacillus jeddahensis]